MDEVIATEVALQELDRIQEVFDVIYDERQQQQLLPAIQAGRVSSDQEKYEIIYTLERPIELKNGDLLGALTIRSPGYTDLEYINRGYTVNVEQNGQANVDMGMIQRRTLRAVSRLSGKPSGVVDRIHRRDMRVLGAMLDFFE